MRYFLAIDTTSRRLPLESSRLTSSYSWNWPRSSRHRLRRLVGLSSVISIRSRSSLATEAIFSAGAPVDLSSSQLVLELVHPLRHFLELPHERLHAAGPQAELFDQHQHLLAAAQVAIAGRRLRFASSRCG